MSDGAAPQGYVPVDFAREYLLQTAHRMERRFRSLWVRPVERDFLSAFEMPALHARRLARRMQVEMLLGAYHRGLLGLHRNTYSRRRR